jgi:hypothetical protein
VRGGGLLSWGWALRVPNGLQGKRRMPDLWSSYPNLCIRCRWLFPMGSPQHLCARAVQWVLPGRSTTIGLPHHSPSPEIPPPTHGMHIKIKYCAE